MIKSKILAKEGKNEYITSNAINSLLMPFKLFYKIYKFASMKNRKVLAVILSISIILTVASVFPITAFAGYWDDVSENGMGFNNGSKFINVTMPATDGYYTYGTDTSETLSNSSTLPASGWSWAVKKGEEAIDNMTYYYTVTLNNFNLSYSGSDDALMLKTDVKLQLKGTNNIYAPSSGTGLSTYGKDIYIYGDGCLDITAHFAVGVADNTVTFAGGYMIAKGVRSVFISANVIINSGLNCYASTDFDGSNLSTYDENNKDSYKYLNIGVATASTWAELQDKINNEKFIILTKDIEALDTDFALDVSDEVSVYIDLNGHNIDRNLKDDITSMDSVFRISGGNLTINDYSTESVSQQGKITGGRAENGGGVYISLGTLTLNGGSIAKNSANYGGGVYIDCGKFYLYGGSITENSAVYSGGGIYNYATFDMNGGIISQNVAESGGGVENTRGTFHMIGGSITNNTSNYNGGGVCINSGTYNMTGGSITENIVNVFGGGVYADNSFSVSGDATIKDNTLNGCTTKSNTYLCSNSYITVLDALTGEIGVTTETPPTIDTPVKIANTSTDSSYTLSTADAEKIFSDNDSFYLALDTDTNTINLKEGIIYSVDISWGTMEFTYGGETWNTQTHVWENGSWSCEPGADKITVTNNGNYDEFVLISYTQSNSAINCSITDGTNYITKPFLAAKNDSKTVSVELENKPTSDISNSVIGSIKISIGDDSTTGFFDIDGNTYYLLSDKSFLSGWHQAPEDGKRYYFDNDGKMVKSCFVTDNEKKYYFDENGHMVTGLKTINDNTYYFNESTTNAGAMVFGSVLYESEWYYFYDDTGIMARNTTINGYYYGNDGKWDGVK